MMKSQIKVLDIGLCDSFHKTTTLNHFAGSSSLEITLLRKLKPCLRKLKPTQNVNAFIYYGTPNNCIIYIYIKISTSCGKESFPLTNSSYTDISQLPTLKNLLKVAVSKIISMELYGTRMEITFMFMKAKS